MAGTRLGHPGMGDRRARGTHARTQPTRLISPAGPESSADQPRLLACRERLL